VETAGPWFWCNAVSQCPSAFKFIQRRRHESGKVGESLRLQRFEFFLRDFGVLPLPIG